MAGIRHQTTVTTPDDGSEVGSNDWNADHTINGNVSFNGYSAIMSTGTGILGTSGDKILTYDSTDVTIVDTGTPTTSNHPYISVGYSTVGNNAFIQAISPATALGFASYMDFRVQGVEEVAKTLQLRGTTASDANIGHSYAYIADAVHHGTVTYGVYNDNAGHTPMTFEGHGTDNFRMRWRTGNAATYINLSLIEASVLEGGPFVNLTWESSTLKAAPPNGLGDGFAGGMEVVSGVSAGGQKVSGAVYARIINVTTAAIPAVVDSRLELKGTLGSTSLTPFAHIGAGIYVGPSTVANNGLYMPGVGRVETESWMKTQPTVVGSLPAASTGSTGNQGARWFVTDASTNTFMTPVVAGGTCAVPVVSNGTQWVIG